MRGRGKRPFAPALRSVSPGHSRRQPGLSPGGFWRFRVAAAHAMAGPFANRRRPAGGSTAGFMSIQPLASDSSLPPLAPEQRRKPWLFEPRMAALYFVVFTPNGFYIPYFPLWLGESGFGPGEIGLLIALPMFARVLAGPAISALADRAPDRVPILLALALLSAGSAAGYLLPPGHGLVLGVSVLFSIFWAPQTPLMDSLALSGVRRYGSDYAGMRIWGSVGYFLANAAGGWLIGLAGAGTFPWMLVAGFAAVVVIGLAAPRLGRPRRPALQPGEALPQAAGIFRSSFFVLFLAASALIQASHAELYTFGTIYWKSIGIGGTAIGMLWAFSVMAEVVMFMLFRRIFGRFPPALVLVLSGLMGVLRWALFPFAWPLGLGLPGLFFLQGLHAFSFSVGFLATQRMLAELVPEERVGAAQGAFYFASNILLALLTLVSGPLYAALGTMSFLVMAGIAAAGAALALPCVRPSALHGLAPATVGDGVGKREFGRR